MAKRSLPAVDQRAAEPAASSDVAWKLSRLASSVDDIAGALKAGNAARAALATAVTAAGETIGAALDDVATALHAIAEAIEKHGE
jgi:ABC-type transporter Mla subunit MlaD